ncbi:MAG TPA: acetylxylan esterase [Gemmata sp.]|nr:acetylxylan esterase [Gemmata sp.]
MRLIIPLLAFFAIAADFRDVDPNVFPADDPRAKELPKMLAADAKRRMREASLRESKTFAALTTKEEWEKFRDARIKALLESLGEFPPVPKEMKLKVTRELEGDGYRIQNIVYETRPGLWANANLYLPAKLPEKMPGIIIAHSHHTPNTQGELQDMGMTWARSGTAVLVPEHIGHGERRQHDFNTEKDYDKPFRVSRQDYYFRYNSALQLSAAGESLMGWMVWDLMRGVDVLLKQPNIDKDRIIMLGAVAGGGDPTGVTAALDPRIACVVPFNFSGWQPESSAMANPDRDFPWFGEGYWETTRGLRNGARDGFAHYVIVGSVAPRKVIYAHEFAWDDKLDPAWQRMQKIFGFYDAKKSLAVAYGKGSVRGQAGPDNTHCNHIGAVHRKMIYPAFKEWFGMPIPEEFSKRRMAEELKCWTDEAVKELKPKKLHEVVQVHSDEMIRAKRFRNYNVRGGLLNYKNLWTKLFGDVEPYMDSKLIEGKDEAVPGGLLKRFALEVEPGIVIPFFLITSNEAKEHMPVAIMVGQGGKKEFLKLRGDAITEFLKNGVAVCLVDVRGTGETQPGNGSPERTGNRTSISQTNLILGTPILKSQFRDLRTVFQWLKTRKGIEPDNLALWGDSFTKLNPKDLRLAVPLDAPEFPSIAEPLGATLAELTAGFEKGVSVIYSRGLVDYESIFTSPYLYFPHDTTFLGIDLPSGVRKWRTIPTLVWTKMEGLVTAQNQAIGDPPMAPIDAAKWMIERLQKK